MQAIPKEQVDRIAVAQKPLISAAEKIWGLLGEYDYEKYEVFSKDGLKITVEKVSEGVISNVFGNQ
jgi:hypothetical protein